MSSDEEAVVSVRKKKFVVDSDGSDEEGKKQPEVENKTSAEESEENVTEENGNKTKKKRKIIRIKAFEDSSSDSDSESVHNLEKNSFKKSSHNGNKIKDESDVMLNIDHSEVVESPMTEVTCKNSWYKNSDLFDEESSEGENDGHSDNEKSDSKNASDNDNILHGKSRRTVSDEDERSTKLKAKPKKNVKPQERKDRKSKQKAQEEIAEIHKETQRMMRASRVSIPYHRPRQRTLAEFLERRKASPTVSLKTSTDQLQSAWKALEQREKEAELFYKSESSEEEIENEEAVQTVKEITASIPDNVAVISVSKLSEEDPLNTTESSNFINKKETNTVETKENISEDNRESLYEIENNVENMSAVTVIEDILKKDKTLSPLKNDKEVVTGNNVTTQKLESTDKSHEEDSKSVNEMFKESSEPSVEEISVTTDSKEMKLPAPNTPTDENSTVDIKIISGNTEDFTLRLSESHSDGDSFSNKTENLVNKDVNSEIPNQVTQIRNSFSENVSISNTEEFSLRMSESQSENVGLFDTDVSVISSQSINQINESEDCNEPKEHLNASSVNIRENEEMDIDSEMNETGIDENEKVVDKITINDKKTSDKTADTEEHKLKEKYNFEPKNLIVGLKMKEPCGGVINLEDVGFKPGVNELINRFQTHMSYKKKPTKKKTQLELSVVSAETDASGHVTSVTEEMVKVLVGGEEEEEDPSMAKPGAKLARLRAHLQAEMGRQREQQWAEKQKETKLYEEEIYEDEKDVCDMEKEAEDNGSEAEIENEESEEEETDEEEEEEEEDEDAEDDTEEKPKKKSLFVDDEAEESDDDNVDEGDDEDSFIKRPKNKKVILQRTPTADMFLSQEVLKLQNTEEEDFPPFQKPQPVEEKTDEHLSEASSVCASPAFPLTGLEGKANSYNWSAPTTPCKDFVNTKTVTPIRVRAQLVSKSPQMCTQDLEHLCSGEFTSQTTQQLEDNQETEDFKLFLEDSQLSLDTTPVKLSPKNQKQNDDKEPMRSLLVEDDDDLPATLGSKKVKKLNFSDDEDAGEEVQDEKEEESEAQSGDETDNGEDNAEVDDVAYDSEENEVVKTAGDFLDKEAELSESEWGSEDEDEHGLDALEMEEADREKIDQHKLKRQLDQMHMKQMLIEDKKQVRMLQEVLLEDGELHSENKRQRLFRWSNNTAFAEDDNKARLDSDEEKGEDDEDEENWRRTRHEREQYLLEHKKKVEKLELEFEEQSDSQLMRLGQKALKRMNSQEPKLTPPVNNPLSSPDAKKPYRQLTTRGSFLARGERVLSRLGQMTSSDGPINQPKNSRNFVFSRVSPTKDQEESKPVAVVQPNKRKKFELPLPIAKKPCIQKPKMANKKSLFDALFKAKS